MLQPAPTHFRVGAGYCYRQFRPPKGGWCKIGVNQRVVIQKVIAALGKSGLCSYTAVVSSYKYYGDIQEIQRVSSVPFIVISYSFPIYLGSMVIA